MHNSNVCVFIGDGPVRRVSSQHKTYNANKQTIKIAAQRKTIAFSAKAGFYDFFIEWAG